MIIHRWWIAWLVAAVLLIPAAPGWSQANRLEPKNLKYLGAFRFPETTGNVDWGYGGNAITHYPAGDPKGSQDGFPGSLFATGNDTNLQVSEITIPAPVISKSKNVDDLPTAKTIQPFTNVFGSMFGALEQPRVGLCYLPPTDKFKAGKIHFAVGMHLQETGFDPSHGWFDTNLSNLQIAGPWVFDDLTGYVTNDYLCQIPKEWADANTPGLYLATGRAREGPWSGGGPGLFAYGPWNDGNPPGPRSKLKSIKPLLLHGEQPPGVPELASRPDQRMPDYSDSDRYRGCEWLTAGNRSAVVFVGTKAQGDSWYGFANGVRWDYECDQPGHPPCPDVPEWPYDNRGFWADDFQARMIFYDPNDLAAVAKGKKKSWEPRPYAVMDLSPWFFDPKFTKDDLIKYKRDFVADLCFDAKNGLLYLIEPVIEEDGRGIVHVFKVE